MAAHFATAVIIPIKSFDDAKERLASVLDAAERHKLAMYTASRVIAAASPFAVFIVCDDDEVMQFARQHGAVAILQQSSGLNNAAQEGLNAARDDGFSWAIIAHSDLPLATDFQHLLEDSMSKTSLGLVADQTSDGTNVLVIATDCEFEFHYGPGSFQAHCDEATRRGYVLRLIDDPALAVDIDTPKDLVHLPDDWQTVTL
ncbi:MAG: 2-phospho-L-lactate guanylyltransferase [Ilumatobacteraceae bacterium]